MNKAAPSSAAADQSFRRRLHDIVFLSDTPAGKLFDLALLAAIMISVVATCAQTVAPYNGEEFASYFNSIEYTVTALFTIEYALRIWCVERPSTYIFSFYGIVDLLSILPTYIGLALKPSIAPLSPAFHSPFTILRSLRLLRVFRVLGLGWFVSEANSLSLAVWQSRAKIVVFVCTVVIIVTLAGTAMYELEGEVNEKLGSIPEGIYWAIVTMTTVGYGDVVPITALGKLTSAILILLGYSLIIVPTGFVSAELANASPKKSDRIRCSRCELNGHTEDAAYCRRCGQPLYDEARPSE